MAHNEYRETDVNKFSALARGRSQAGILAEATEGRPERSPRYASLIRPFGLEGEVRAAFVANGACWGGMALFRTPDQLPFESRDRRFLEGISRHVAEVEGIRTSLVLGRSHRRQVPGPPG